MPELQRGIAAVIDGIYIVFISEYWIKTFLHTSACTFDESYKLFQFHLEGLIATLPLPFRKCISSRGCVHSVWIRLPWSVFANLVLDCNLLILSRLEYKTH